MLLVKILTLTQLTLSEKKTLKVSLIKLGLFMVVKKTNDDSGVLKYVSIRHGGTSIGAGNEINGRNSWWCW